MKLVFLFVLSFFMHFHLLAQPTGNKSGTIRVRKTPIAISTKSFDSLKTAAVVSFKETDAKDGYCFYKAYEQQPAFPGGNAEMTKFISSKSRYPDDAIYKGKEGVVYLSFVVTALGLIEDISVLKGVFPSIDREAIRVVKMMPSWRPGRDKGQAISVKFCIPIRFALE